MKEKRARAQGAKGAWRAAVLAVMACGLLTPLDRAASSAELVDRVIAVVGREAITLSEAVEAQQLGLLKGSAAPELADVVERLIESLLVEREVDRYPAGPVSREAIDRALETLKESFGSVEDFEAVLRSQGISVNELRVVLRRQIRISRYLERRFRPLVYITADEVERFYENELVPELRERQQAVPRLETVEGDIRRLLEEREFNRRVEAWIAELKEDVPIRRYVW